MKLENYLLTLQPFIVNLIGLASGESHYDWHADAEFFGIFDNSEILDADLDIELILNNHGVTVDAECYIDGTVTVACDRCLENLEIPVSTSFEDSYVTDGEDLDFSQDIYDYVCIALPLQRVHEDGECNPDTIKFLSK